VIFLGKWAFGNQRYESKAQKYLGGGRRKLKEEQNSEGNYGPKIKPSN
jgi:hypothetical protein